MDAETPEFQDVNNSGDEVLDNTFIMYCDERGVEIYEKMLGIYTTPEDTLDIRRNRVMARWNDAIPYTRNSILHKIKVLQGNDDAQILFDKNSYTITVLTAMDKPGQQDDLAYILKTLFPCNLIVTSINNIKLKNTLTQPTAIKCAITERVSVKS